MVQIKIHNTSENPLPEYATPGSAGLDLRANLKESVVIDPLERMLIPTGLSIELPVGYEAQIRPRSGLSLKNGIVAIQGTIDSDYRGDIGMIVVNLSNVAFTIEPGMRLAQMIIAKYEQTQLIEAETLSETERNSQGFGSSGIK